MVLGDVEETITVVDVDEDTLKEVIRVRTRRLSQDVIFIDRKSRTRGWIVDKNNGCRIIETRNDENLVVCSNRLLWELVHHSIGNSKLFGQTTSLHPSQAGSKRTWALQFFILRMHISQIALWHPELPTTVPDQRYTGWWYILTVCAYLSVER